MPDALTPQTSAIHARGLTKRFGKFTAVDGATGALLVEDPGAPGTEREILAGEVVHVRLAAEDDESAAAAGPNAAAADLPDVTP